MKQLRHPEAGEVALTEVLSALGDPSRLSIVSTLAESGGERPWCEFAATLGLADSTLSHHMKILRTSGVIRHRKEGTRCFVSLRPDLEATFPGLIDRVVACAMMARGEGPAEGR